MMFFSPLLRLLVFPVLLWGPSAFSAPQLTCASSFASFRLFEEKPEVKLVSLAFENHVSQHNVDEIATKSALKSFADIIDPLGMGLFESERQELLNPTSELVTKVHNEVFFSETSEYFVNLTKLMTARYEKLMQMFLKDSRIRRQVLPRVQEIKTHPPDSNKQVSYPKDMNDMSLHLVNYLAQKVIWYQEFLATTKTTTTEIEAYQIVLRNARDTIELVKRKLSPDDLSIYIASAYVDYLDPHSSLSDPYDTNAQYKRMRSSRAGVGVQFYPTADGIKVSAVVPDSPAERAGIREGDLITHIEGSAIDPYLNFKTGSPSKGRVSVKKIIKGVFGQLKSRWVSHKSFSTSTFFNFFEGTLGSKLGVKIIRDGEIRKIKIIRQNIETSSFAIETEISTIDQGEIAHINFRSFYHGSALQLRGEIEKIKSKHKLVGVILDLRLNGGGSVDELIGILGLFVEKGPAFGTISAAETKMKNISAGNKTAWDGPLLVITDPYSASASEALSGALQDYSRAIIVGGPNTFGKGTLQSDFLSGMLRLTTDMYFTPSGQSPQLKGVSSDILFSRQAGYYTRMETNLPGALPPLHAKSYLEQSDLLPGEKLKSHLPQLREQSRQRQVQQPAADSDQEILRQNTLEAMAIMKDYIEASGTASP